MALQDITVPDIGNYKNVDIIEVLVKVGDRIQKDQSLITLETDKATMEIPSSEAGIIKELLVKPGVKVSQGSVLLKLELAPASAPAVESALGAESGSPPAQTVLASLRNSRSVNPTQLQEQVPCQANKNYIHAGPAVRQLARELAIDLNTVTGTGQKGRITREDLSAVIKSQMSGGSGAGLGLLPDPQVDFAEFGAVRVEKLPRIKKISGACLLRNAIKIPHITLFDEADITDLEAFRSNKKAIAEKAGLKLTPVPFLIKAVAMALRAHPIVNASLSADGENLVLKDYIHIGVAVDTPNGLMVPVLRNAEQKGLLQIAKELGELSLRAREGKLKGEDMKGGCFTISSLGGLGTTAFTPIVNMPEVGILGVSRAQMKPVWNGKEFLPRLMLPLSLSLDHRVVDGADGARFLTQLVQSLSDLRELIL